MKRNPEFAFAADKLERDWGIIAPFSVDFMPDDRSMAMDALPSLITTPNAGIPMWYNSFVDPEVIRIFQTPNKGAQIFPEQKKGSWVDQTAFFPAIENTGEVSTYGDFNANGRSGANANFVQRQSYLFQTVIEYGELEEERAGEARLNWVSELQIAAAKTLDKFMDFTYHFGVIGLENYGILNDPHLSAPLTPATKAFAGSGTKWVYQGAVTATANEVFNDVLSLFQEIQVQAPGLVDEDADFVLVVPNTVSAALGATNTFGLTARGMIKEVFPKLEVVVDPRYALAAGNEIQLIARTIDGRQVGICGFNEKQRDHKLIPYESSYRQKKTAGTWGAIVRYPLAVASMLGV